MKLSRVLPLLGLMGVLGSACDRTPVETTQVPVESVQSKLPRGYDLYGLILKPPQNPQVPVLVFAFAARPADRSLAGKPFLAVTPVGADGRFGFSGLESTSLTIAFLLDDGHDAAIDRADSVAVLVDPEGHLENLSGARQILLRDMTLEFDHQRASATRIEVERQSDAGSTPLP